MKKAAQHDLLVISSTRAQLVLDAGAQSPQDALQGYLPTAQSVFDALEDVAIGLSATATLATLRCAVPIDCQTDILRARDLYRSTAEIARGLFVPMSWKHHHGHLLAAVQSIGEALRLSQHLVSPLDEKEIEQVMKALEIGTREMNLFNRRLPGYRLMSGCGCEVMRREYGAEN